MADAIEASFGPASLGVLPVDVSGAIYLTKWALALAVHLLKPETVALMKLLQGAGCQSCVAAARREFSPLRFLKADAWRTASPETYLLASGRRMV